MLFWVVKWNACIILNHPTKEMNLPFKCTHPAYAIHQWVIVAISVIRSTVTCHSAFIQVIFVLLNTSIKALEQRGKEGPSA
jgi:hypothetical protein